MAYRTPIIIAATAGAIFVPVSYEETSSKPKQLPQGVTRSFTPSGLELLLPREAGSNPAASWWLRKRSVLREVATLPRKPRSRCIFDSLSLSGHGLSPRPANFVTMKATNFARDLEGALDYISTLHPDQPRAILVGHSAGGVLSQAMLSNTQNETLTSGLVLIAAFPPTGGWPVYMNRFFADPWFGGRVILQGGDPKSPLSTPALVRKIFFGPKMKEEDLLEFFDDMNPEESIGWPSSMMFPFVNVEKVKQHANGKVAWICGHNDVVMTPKLMKGAAEKYQAPLTIVPSAGHRMLRDEVWKDAADAVLTQLQAWSL